MSPMWCLPLWTRTRARRRSRPAGRSPLSWGVEAAYPQLHRLLRCCPALHPCNKRGCPSRRGMDSLFYCDFYAVSSSSSSASRSLSAREAKPAGPVVDLHVAPYPYDVIIHTVLLLSVFCALSIAEKKSYKPDFYRGGGREYFVFCRTSWGHGLTGLSSLDARCRDRLGPSRRFRSGAGERPPIRHRSRRATFPQEGGGA